MVQGTPWSRQEVQACVADYLHMLALELNGQRYSKAAHIRALTENLQGRNSSAIQFKYCNISAILLELGYPYIEGYKPRANYQTLLFQAVEAGLQLNHSLQEAAQSAVTRPATTTAIKNLECLWVEMPTVTQRLMAPQNDLPGFSPVRRDYLAQEARNRSLGHAGELFVVELEARRLHAAGQKRLANRVEQVSVTQGDGLGYDVLSYEKNGSERFIEVKTTAFGKLTPFYVTRNELLLAAQDDLHAVAVGVWLAA